MNAWEIPYEDRLVTGPTLEPLDLEEVRKQRRFSSTSIDTLFDLWMGAARQQFEEETGLQLLTATRVFLLDEWPQWSCIYFNRGPVQSIVSVTYVDGDGAEQTMDAADYAMMPPLATVDTYPTPGGIQLASGGSWPSAGTQKQAIRIQYVAGFGSAPGAVPEIIRQALYLYVGSFHQQGEESSDKELFTLPVGVQMVIREAKGHMRRTVIPTRSSTSAALWTSTWQG